MSRRLRDLLPVCLAALTLAGMCTTVAFAFNVGESLTDLSQLPVYATAAVVGVLVLRAQRRNPVGWMLLAAAAGLATADAGAYLARSEAPGALWIAWSAAVTRPGWMLVLLAFVPLHFPDGLLTGRRWVLLRRVLIGLLAVSALYEATRPGSIQMTDVANPVGLETMRPFVPTIDLLMLGALLAGIAAALASVVVRYRRGGRVERNQIKWLAYALGVWLVLVAVSFPVEAWSPAAFQIVELGLVAAGVTLPVAIGIAIVRHALYDIDLVINRTLVYGALTVTIVLLYVVIVGYLGATFQDRGSLVASLVATAVVAVAFSPLRERLQHAANRLVYGDRDDPYLALTRLGRRLDEATGPKVLLALAAAEVAEALRLSYVAIDVSTSTGSTTAAFHGTPRSPGQVVRLPLQAHGATVGWLVLASQRVEEFSDVDRRLLDDLMRPIGTTVHAYRLASDLQASRERLIVAREEERGRLHRDLHDGLAPELATMSMLGEAARDAVKTDPDRAERLLETLVDRAQQAVSDLRHVVYGLRPVAIDALGLVGALRAYAATHNQPGLQIEIDAVEADPQLPPAVEVATYRIVVEAITNVIRHAQARRCTVSLGVVPQALHVEIIDDGRGVNASDPPGVGIASMQERAAELGGQCTVAPAAEGGTAVRVHLPLTGTETTPAGATTLPAGARG